MQTLQIILSLAASIAYAVMVFFVIYATNKLRQQEKTLHRISDQTDSLMKLNLAQLVRSQTEQLNELRGAYNELVENEDYKGAGEMKKIIEEQEKSIKNNIDELTKAFGKQVVGTVMVRHDYDPDDD